MTTLIAPLWLSRSVRLGCTLTTFFGLKFGIGLLLIGASTALLSKNEFVTFSQLFLFFALLSTVSAAGVQNGLARQIATARGDPGCEHRAAAAAFRIWAATGVVGLIVVTLLRHPISSVLTGDVSLAGLIPAVTVIAVVGGPGILACAVLNGRDRAMTSLFLQSAGLALGGLLCLWRLSAADPVGAVFGYAAGLVVTSLLATLLLHRMGISFLRPATGQRQEIQLLVGYSVTFVMIAIIMPCTLFALRHVYREAFGTDLLSYWLAANRVSDVTSQVLGLYMAQIFLPRAASETDPHRLRRLLGVTMLFGSVVMLTGWVVFMLGAPFLVTTFLSASYLGAIPFIAGYLLGDGLRVTTSMGVHLMIAQGRLAAAIVIEATTAILLATYVVGLAALGRPEAPYWGYPAAYATMALILMLAAIVRWLKMNGRSDRVEDAVR